MEDCIFCKIINREVPAKILFESESVIAFPDISPAADVHVLIVPKQHVINIHEAKNNGQLLADIYTTADELVEKHSLRDGRYRIIVNAGKAQHIPHLHFHLLGGEWRKDV